MARLRIQFLLLLYVIASFSFAAASLAQTPGAPPPRSPGWVSGRVEQLAEHATFHTSFTFDRSMLRFANNFMDNGDAATQQAVSRLDQVTVYSFHFSQPGSYDPAVLKRIRADYDATGWKHLVTAHPHGDPFQAGQTDLWISFAHTNVTGMIVMVQAEKDIDLIAITGNLSPLDLLHLRGHFGIPKFNDEGMALGQSQPDQPAPSAGAQPRPDYNSPNQPEGSASPQ